MTENTHRVMDLAKLRRDLGYRDIVPAREAIALTAHWLKDHPPARGGVEETALTDPFDYAAEDRLIGAWQRVLASMPDVRFETDPGYTLAYSGPGGRARASSLRRKSRTSSSFLNSMPKRLSINGAIEWSRWRLNTVHSFGVFFANAH